MHHFCSLITLKPEGQREPGMMDSWMESRTEEIKEMRAEMWCRRAELKQATLQINLKNKWLNITQARLLFSDGPCVCLDLSKAREGEKKTDTCLNWFAWVRDRRGGEKKIKSPERKWKENRRETEWKPLAVLWDDVTTVNYKASHRIPSLPNSESLQPRSTMAPRQSKQRGSKWDSTTPN